MQLDWRNALYALHRFTRAPPVHFTLVKKTTAQTVEATHRGDDVGGGGGDSTWVGGVGLSFFFFLLSYQATLWNRMGLTRPERILGTWTLTISEIISGKLTRVCSD